ncbi:MAG: efflux RND transporter permease subunit, partial [Faecousia sp.]
SSTSAENVSMVFLQFDDDVNMDTIGVDIQQKITTLSAGWDDMVGSPYVLKINPSMLPVEVAALSMEGMDTMELTDFLNDTLMNELEGIPGVARITATGMIEQELHVVLDQKLIDDLNQKIMDAVNGELDDAAQELTEKKEELEDAQSEISSAESKLNEGANALVQGEAKLKEEKKKLEAAQAELEAQLKQAKQGRIVLKATYETLNALNEQVNNVVSAQQSAQNRVEALTALQEERARIEALRQEIEALENGSVSGEPDPDEEADSPAPPEEEKSDEEAAGDGAEAAALLPAVEGDLTAEEAAFFGEAQTGGVLVDLGYGVKALTSSDQVRVTAMSNVTEETEIALKKAELAQLEAAYNAHLAANGVTDATLDLALAGAKAELAAADAAVEQIDAILVSQDTDRDGLAATVAETKQQLDQVTDGIAQLEAAQEQLAAGMLTVEEAEEMLEQQKLLGMLQISTAAGKLAAGSASIEMALTQVESGLDTIEDSREDALRQADLNQIITMDMVTQILNAQNFAMPAGYVEQDGIHYMVSVGDEITDLETLQNLLLFDLGLEGVDPIYLKDVAVVVVTDNSAETYAKLNGQDGVMLSFEKQSTYATAEATNNIADRFRELEAEYPGLKFVSLMNQGDYIYIIVESIMN